MDLVGPFNEKTIGGARFILTIVDRYSGWVCTYPMKQKSQVLEMFKQFLADEGLAQWGTVAVVECMTDWGTEFENPFKAFAYEKGIKIRKSCPYTAWENGLAEQKNKEVVHVAKCLLRRARLDAQFWGHALSTACYIINRVSTRSNPNAISPYEMNTGWQPNLSKLRVFGCHAEVYIEKHLRDKRFSESGDHSRSGIFWVIANYLTVMFSTSLS